MTTATKPARKLGATGPEVFPIALGCMGMSGMYGATDDAESIATIHAALDAGINLIDTGDFYGMGHNEMLIGRALRIERDQVLLSVKFGAQRAPNGTWLGYDSRPAAVKTALAYSLKRLGVDYIDIYRPSRLDPQVPIEDTIGAIAEMVQAGYVRHIGLSEVGPETIRRAAAVHPIVDLQIEYALVSRGPEAKIFPVLEALGIGVTAYPFSLAACFPPPSRQRPATCAPTSLASAEKTWPATSSWSSGSVTSPRLAASPRCSWPWPGPWPKALRLCRSSAPAPALNWPRAWAQSRSISPPRRLRPSKPRSRRSRSRNPLRPPTK